jgi:hypothetical protein
MGGLCARLLFQSDSKVNRNIRVRESQAVCERFVPRFRIVSFVVLADGIQTQLLADQHRIVTVDKLSEGQTEEFLRRRGLSPTRKIVVLARTKSEGLPICLYDIAMLLLEVGDNEYLQEKLLNNLPELKNNEIDTYHETLYGQISQNALAVGTLALLAVRREFTDTATLLNLLSRIGVQSDTLLIDRKMSCHG